MHLSISFKGHSRQLDLDDSLTFGDFLLQIENETEIPSDFVKLIVPTIGIVKIDKYPGGLSTPISDVFINEQSRKKIILMGTPMNKIQELQETEAAKAKEHAKYLQRTQNLRRLARRPIRTQSSASSSSSYTFHKIEPLPFLPNPDKARKLLEKLRDDRGIKAIMEKYKFTVGVLSELDPASSTSHSSRLLGLNTGMGQMIQLRIRTDDYEGFCSYKEIRKVLCHELTHNVHSDHDRKFWDFCKKLEKEVVDLDPFGNSGNQIGEDVYDGPGFGGDTDEMLECDEGGWFGSTQRLGTLETSSSKSGNISNSSSNTNPSSISSSSTATSSLNAQSPTTNVSVDDSSVVVATTTPPSDEDSVQARIRRAAEERRRGHNHD